MLAPRSDAPKQRRRRAKLNTSSRTKTNRETRKKDKEASSVKQFEIKIEKLLLDDELLLPKLFDDAAIDTILGEELVDGLVVNAPDTPENQKVYPQSQSQKPGLGFPQIRLCAAICLATGVVADLQYGRVVGKKTGELTLFRKMFDNLKCGDLIVADSLFDCFRDHATLKAKGVDMICDKNGTRESPFTGRYQQR